MVRKLTATCPECSITSEIIDMELFACFSQSHVTYRARLQGTSETDSGSFISLIEDWVDSKASIGVSGLLMKVDSKCSVEISSFSEEECLDEIIPASTPDPTPSRKINVDLTPVLTSSRKFNVVSTTDTTPSQKNTVGSTPGPNAGPTDSTTDSANTISPGPIIGGIVAVLVILIIALSTTCIIIVVLILKYRRGDPKKIK